MISRSRMYLAALTAAWLVAAPVLAQQILLDKPVKAGELTLFPDLNDEKVYYYLSDKPRLATDENGRAQFSFLRYVQNVRSGADEEEAREGEGGGIVHALVALAVSEEQLRDAQRDLQRSVAGASIRGPIVYKSGKFGLVSSFTDTEGNLTQQVLGLGAAPILDGQKAAVSIQLTKLGAKILWESFKTPTPDISFSFEMDVTGFRSPKRAVIEANFDQIYDHQAFAVGLASTYLQAEVKGAFDDLRREGAIKVTQVGEDAKMEQLITTAYNKITEMMFKPLGGTGTPSLASLGGTAGGGPGALDRATQALQRNRTEARAENTRIRRENREAEARAAAARRTGGTASGTGAGGTGTGTGGAAGGTGSTARPSAGTGGTSTGGGTTGAGAARPGTDSRRRPYASTQPSLGGTHTDTARPPAGASGRQSEETVPAISLVAMFEMKRVRQRGKFKIDLNKYTADSLTMRFDENIGDMRRYMDDETHFRQVNLDDPLYRQRELVVFVDGMNAQDFGDYINFVSVQMRKRHAKGDVTDDEVRIDRGNFNREGNNFKLLYGWKGDDDRRRWLEYEYRATWSFFGGQSVEQDWQESTTGAINLAPAYQRRRVELEADPDLLADGGVRLVTVRIYYDLGGKEQMKQASLSPSKEKLSEVVEFMLPADQLEYEYEIMWRLKGNKSVSSGRQTSSEAILFVDELPEA